MAQRCPYCHEWIDETIYRSHCAEHARCRAVQEASAVLWGDPGARPPEVGPDDGRSAELAGRAPTLPQPPGLELPSPGGIALSPRALDARTGA